MAEYRELTATIDKIELGKTGDREWRSYSIKVPWSQYPNKSITSDPDLWAKLVAGQSYTLILARGKAKKEPPQGERDYFWDLAGIKGVKEPEGYKSPAPAEATKPATQTAPPKSNGGYDDGRGGRQTALNVAAQVFGSLIVEGKDVTPEMINKLLRVAAYASRFVNEGWVPAETPAVAPGAPPEGTGAGERPEMPPKTAPKPSETIQQREAPLSPGAGITDNTLGAIKWTAGHVGIQVADIAKANGVPDLAQLTEAQGQKIVAELNAKLIAKTVKR